MGDNASKLSAQEHGQKLEQIQAKGLVDAGQQELTKSVERAVVREETPNISGDFGTEG